jgi:small-conductance mechanosensitive channel
MTGGMLLTLTAVLGAVLAGLGYLGHRGNRPVPAKIVWAACLTILSACVWWAVEGRLVGGTSAAAMPWVQLAAGVCGALFVLLVADHLLVGEYLIQRRGRYLPELARTLMIGIGLACVTLVLLDTVLNINVIALVALPTVATAVVGVALKDVFARFFAGIQLGKMIRTGDWISTLEYEGMVTAVGAEHVSLLTRDQDLLMLPHDRVIEGGVKNFTRPTPVHISSVTVSATSKMSPVRVCAVLAEAAGAVNGVVPDPQPVAYVTAFTDSGIEYQLRWAITDCSRRLAIKSQVLSYVWNAFQRNGIDIPFPQRIVRHASETAPAGTPSMSGQQLFDRLRAIDPPVSAG